VAGGGGLAPAAARRFDRRGVAAVEQVAAAGKGTEIVGLDPVHQYQHRRAVRVVVALRQPDRLRRGIAVAGGAVRQEARIVVGPQQRVEVLDPLGRGGAHDDPVILRPRALEKARQGAFERP
jgi:hypothetical protein